MKSDSGPLKLQLEANRFRIKRVSQSPLINGKSKLKLNAPAGLDSDGALAHLHMADGFRDVVPAIFCIRVLRGLSPFTSFYTWAVYVPGTEAPTVL